MYRIHLCKLFHYRYLCNPFPGFPHCTHHSHLYYLFDNILRIYHFLHLQSIFPYSPYSHYFHYIHNSHHMSSLLHNQYFPQHIPHNYLNMLHHYSLHCNPVFRCFHCILHSHQWSLLLHIYQYLFWNEMFGLLHTQLHQPPPHVTNEFHLGLLVLSSLGFLNIFLFLDLVLSLHSDLVYICNCLFLPLFLC